MSGSAGSLRTQGVVIRWAHPISLAVIALAAGLPVSATVTVIALAIAVPLGILTGM